MEWTTRKAFVSTPNPRYARRRAPKDLPTGQGPALLARKNCDTVDSIWRQMITDEDLMRVVELTNKVIKKLPQKNAAMLPETDERHNTMTPVLQRSRLSLECCTCVVLFAWVRLVLTRCSTMQLQIQYSLLPLKERDSPSFVNSSKLTMNPCVKSGGNVINLLPSATFWGNQWTFPLSFGDDHIAAP